MAVHGPINSGGTAGIGGIGWNYHCFICGAYGPHDCIPQRVPQHPVVTLPPATHTFNSQGWECPRCQSVFAPWVYQCQPCNSKEKSHANPSPNHNPDDRDPGNQPAAVP